MALLPGDASSDDVPQPRGVAFHFSGGSASAEASRTRVVEVPPQLTAQARRFAGAFLVPRDALVPIA